MHITLLGLGEAGALFAKDLAAAGTEVTGYDPAPVTTPPGVTRQPGPAEAVANADVIIAATAAADAWQALNQAFEHIPAEALYADFSTAAPALKQQLAERAAQRSIAFADIALLAVVPGKGIRTNALASGSGAQRFVDIFSQFGMPVEAISTQAGEAAARKLLRSVFMKGFAAVTIEAMQAAQQMGLTEWLWDNISREVAEADELLLKRLVTGTERHAARRLHEMETATELLEDIGVQPIMTRATTASINNVLAVGLPALPTQTNSPQSTT